MSHYYIDIEFDRIGIYRDGKCVLRLPCDQRAWDENEAGARLGRLLAELQAPVDKPAPPVAPDDEGTQP